MLVFEFNKCVDYLSLSREKQTINQLPYSYIVRYYVACSEKLDGRKTERFGRGSVLFQ